MFCSSNIDAPSEQQRKANYDSAKRVENYFVNINY